MYQEVQFITSFGKSSIHLGLLLNLLFYIMLCWMYMYTSSVLSSFYLPWPKIIYARCPTHIFPVIVKTNQWNFTDKKQCVYFFFYNYTTSTMGTSVWLASPPLPLYRLNSASRAFLGKAGNFINSSWRKLTWFWICEGKKYMYHKT